MSAADHVGGGAQGQQGGRITGGDKVSSRDFYREYHGHRVEHLRQILRAVRPPPPPGGTSPGDSAAAANTPTTTATPKVRVIWTAGDSSLDNKYWFDDRVPAVPPYADVLDPPVMKPDVTYWLNHHLLHSGSSNSYSSSQPQPPQPPRTVAVNAAVEATTVNERTFRLRPQDVFVRDNLQPHDVLIVSVGGNDVALCPLPCTVASVGCLVCLPGRAAEAGCTCGSVPFDDACGGFGPSLLSCLGSCPPCVGYVKHLLGTRVQAYVRSLTSKTKPDMVLVCTVYYPDENPSSPSWAGPALAALGYNSRPAKLQRLIRLVHDRATSRIHVAGVREVVPVPLFRVLDGRTSEDYVARVEPSPSGGRKMAEYLLHVIQQHEENDDDAVQTPYTAAAAAPVPSPPSDRQHRQRQHHPVPSVMHDRD